MSLALARTLVVSELVPRARMGQLLARAVRQGRSLAVVLAEEDEELVLAALAKDPTPLVPDLEIDHALLARLPAGLPERLGVAPLVGYSEANLVALAMMDPTDRAAALEVERLLNSNIMRVRVRPLLLRKALMEASGESSSRVDGSATSAMARHLDGSATGATAHPVPSEREPHTLHDPPSPRGWEREVTPFEGVPHLQPTNPPRGLLPGEYELPGVAEVARSMAPSMPMPPSRSEPPPPVRAPIRTPPFGSWAGGEPIGEDDEPIPLVRKASQAPPAPKSGGTAPGFRAPQSAPLSAPPPPPTQATSRYSRTLAPPPSMSAPPSFSPAFPPEHLEPRDHRVYMDPPAAARRSVAPSFSPPPPRAIATPLPASFLPPRTRSGSIAAPRRVQTPTAIPNVGLHSFTRMSLEEYTERLSMLRSAKHRDDVTGEMLTLGHAVAEQVIVFAARADRYIGWSASLALGKVRDLDISAREPTVFTRAALEDGYLGPLVATPAQRELVARLIGHHAVDTLPPPEVAIWPVLVAKRPALFLLCAKLTDPLVATQRMAEICRAAAGGLFRLLRGGRS